MTIYSGWIFPLKMVIFHSYVSLPEGSPKKTMNSWVRMIKTRPHIFNPTVQVSIFVAANPTEFIRILGLHVRCIQLTLLLDMDVFFHVFLYGYHDIWLPVWKENTINLAIFKIFSNGENDDHPWLKTGRFPPFSIPS